MLSHESRYFVVVAASAVAGAAVAWVPLTSAPLPFRETSSYPIWPFYLPLRVRPARSFGPMEGKRSASPPRPNLQDLVPW